MPGIGFADERLESGAGIVSVNDADTASGSACTAKCGVDRDPTLVCIFAVQIDFDNRLIHNTTSE